VASEDFGSWRRINERLCVWNYEEDYNLGESNPTQQDEPADSYFNVTNNISW